jgi:hypothetical protein
MQMGEVVTKWSSQTSVKEGMLKVLNIFNWQAIFLILISVTSILMHREKYSNNSEIRKKRLVMVYRNCYMRSSKHGHCYN